MEPQDNNMQFTGTPQSETVSFSEPKASSGPWKIISIIVVILAIGLAAGLTFFMMKSNENSKKIDELNNSLSVTTNELNRFKDATGVNNPDEIISNDEVDFLAFYEVLNSAGLTAIPTLSIVESGANASFIKLSTDKKYQIASFAATGTEAASWTAYFYRALPDGEWKFSDFSGQAVPTCNEVSDEEIAAFDGVVECTEAAATDGTETQ